MYMKSLIAKGARSIFMTSEKNVFLCAEFVHASMEKLNIDFTIYLLFASYIRIRNAF